MMRIETSDIVEVQVFVEDKPPSKYTLYVPHPKLFETMAHWIGLPKADIPPYRLIYGKIEPRHWRLELRFEGAVDKELLDRIRLEDPEIKVLSPEPEPRGMEQSIRVGAEVGDGKADVPNPTMATETPDVDIRLLAPKVEETKKMDTTDKSHGGDTASKDQDRVKTPSLGRIFKPAAPRVAIRVAQVALDEARRHAATSHNEVGGVLVGKYNEPKDKDGAFSVEIWDAIPGKGLLSRGASVTFTADTWSTAIREVEEKYGEELYIVGWYHTHPGFGVFMSGYDRFIHDNYFNEPWQVALVIDPYAKKEGFFAWHVNDEKEQTLEKYPEKQIELLEGVWHPPVKPPPEKPIEPKEPTKEEPKEEIATPVPEPSGKQESQETSETPRREPVAASEAAERQALPSEDVQVVEGHSTQESEIHHEHGDQQTEKSPDQKSDQATTSVSEELTTPSAKVSVNAVSYHNTGTLTRVVTFAVSVVTIPILLLRRRR